MQDEAFFPPPPHVFLSICTLIKLLFFFLFWRAVCEEWTGVLRVCFYVSVCWKGLFGILIFKLLDTYLYIHMKVSDVKVIVANLKGPWWLASGGREYGQKSSRIMKCIVLYFSVGTSYLWF